MLGHEGAGWGEALKPFPYNRVLVTGGAGFLGSYVVEKLRERGVKDIYVVRSLYHDLREKDAVWDLLFTERPELVIHMVRGTESAKCQYLRRNAKSTDGSRRY